MPGSVFPVKNKHIIVNIKNNKLIIGIPGDNVSQIVGIKNTKYNTHAPIIVTYTHTIMPKSLHGPPISKPLQLNRFNPGQTLYKG